MCVNVIGTGSLVNICTECVTGAGAFEKVMCGYGIRTRIRIPESGMHIGSIPVEKREIIFNLARVGSSLRVRKINNVLCITWAAILVNQGF